MEGMDKIDMVMDTVIYIMDEDMVDMVIGYGGMVEDMNIIVINIMDMDIMDIVAMDMKISIEIVRLLRKLINF